MKRLVGILACICFLLTLQAAGNYRFRHLTSQDGLPHQQVEALAQDHDGNIWIGTRNGLVRYDGYEMHCYFHDETKAGSLSNNFIKVIRCDSKGRIWVCTEAGISRYRPDTDDFSTYHGSTEHVLSLLEMASGRIVGAGDFLTVYDEKADSFVRYPSLEIGFIVSMAVDKDDNLYVASNTSVYSYDASLTKMTRLDPALYQDFTTGIDGIMPMMFDHKGNLWLGRNGQGVMCVDLKTGQKRIFAPHEISHGIVREIAEDNDHNIWLGTERGLTVIHPDGGIDIIRHRFQAPTLISDNAIYSILNDCYGNLWIGSYFGGVDILLRSNKLFAWAEPGYAQGQLNGKVVRQMCETTPGVFWIATEDAGVFVYDANRQQFAPLPTKGVDMGTNVHTLCYDNVSHDMWIGTFRYGLFRYNLTTGRWQRYLLTNGLTSDAIFDLAFDRQHRLWVATTQGLRRYDPQTDCFLSLRSSQSPLNTTFVYTLCATADGSLWAGCASGGLFRLDSETEQVQHWTRQAGGLRENYVTAVFQDHQGTLWIGTNNSGLQFMTAPYRSIETFELDATLRNATVCSISEDADHHLWIATGRGLYQYDLDKQTVRRYTTQDGLPTNQFNFSSALLCSDSTMLFGTVNGLVSLTRNHRTHQKLTVEKERTATYAVHLSSLVINNKVMLASTEESPLTKALDVTDTISLSYDQARSFTIQYGVIAPGQNSSIEYQLWLEGIDSDWRSVGSERRFNGYNLHPGTYRLHLRANSSNDAWDSQPERVVTIIVRPPFYLTLWAFLVYMLLMVVIAYVVWRVFNERMRSRNEVRLAKMEKAKLEEIDRAKLDFFTTVSHELKTPLSLIVAPLRSLSRQEQALTGESEQHLNMAIKNAQKMEALINELVTFNKLETDQFPFYIQRGNPLELIGRIAKSFAEPARAKGLQLMADTEDNGEEVWFSPNYLDLMLNNLLTNALKFTPEGGVITVKGRIIDSDGLTYLQFSVSDTGIGIAEEEQKNIFERYYQTKRGHNVNNSGWGIGLSLVKRLADVHKGDVGVESSPGSGSTFTCRLCVSPQAFDDKCLLTDDKVIVPLSDYTAMTPVSPDSDVESVHSEGNENNEEDQRSTLLIVEDNEDLLEYLRSYFSKDCRVLTARNGKEAMASVAEEEVNLVVSDVMMPEMDGITLCRTLKGAVETSHIPVILLTAKSDSADVVAGYKSGAEAYVSKPFDPEVLELQIKNIIQLQKTRQSEVQHAADEADIEATSLSDLDKNFIRQISELVDQNIANSDFSVADITSALLISRSLLHVKMKTLVGMSMGDYIRTKRLDRAEKMLRQGYNVSETAYATGFSDPNYFSRTFKKHKGINPSFVMP